MVHALLLLPVLLSFRFSVKVSGNHTITNPILGSPLIDNARLLKALPLIFNRHLNIFAFIWLPANK